jgi:transposase
MRAASYPFLHMRRAAQANRRKPGPIIEAACWAHARRKFFDLARIDKAPIAVEAVERIDVLFAIEREINGLTPHERAALRHERSRPLVVALETWLREQRAKLSGQSEAAKAIAYSLTRWAALTRFLDDGRLCMSNSPTTPPNARFAPSPWAARTGPSPDRTKAGSARPRSTR